MKERPILFSGEMVRAILDGRKTQTRRFVKPQPIGFTGRKYIVPNEAPKAWRDSDDFVSLCPYGAPSDRLWVRETWAQIPEMKPSGYFTNPEWKNRVAWYRADNDKPMWGGAWRPSIHMPRWASRITLEIVNVRAERLSAITESDAETEGIRRWSKDGNLWKFGTVEPGDTGARPWSEMRRSAREAFADLWDSINGKRPGCSWADDPWVWAISFGVVRQRGCAGGGSIHLAATTA